VQGGVPPQAGGQVAQVRQHHLGADQLQAVEAAEETHRGHQGIGVAQGHHLDRHALALAGHLAEGARLEMGTAGVDDPG
jgi:hypothetical protein